MCYQNPDELLANIMRAPMPRNEIGHTALDDFDHFCAFSGLSEAQAGHDAFAWAKAAFVSAWLGRHDIAAKH
jgi:hypothetical protein